MTRRALRMARAIVLFETCLFLAPAVFSAETEQPAAVAQDDLVQMARDAKQQFTPFPRQLVPEARARSLAAAKTLEAHLARGTKKNAIAWKKYLRWDRMMAELQKPTGANAKQLGSVAGRYFRNYAGLERPCYTELRDALIDYIDVLTMTNDSQLAENYEKRLDRLIDLLSQYEQNPSAEAGEQIGQIIGWLEKARQAAPLVEAARARGGHPNLYAEVSQWLVGAGIAVDIDEDSDVRECILGTSVYGTATMDGKVNVRLPDNDDSAHLKLILRGTVNSKNVGYNRGVKIYSRGKTEVTATKPVYVRASGIASRPATASCSTRSRIDGISAKSCLVERIAWKKVRRSIGSAERIASRRAERHVAQRMDKRADELLEQTKTAFQEKFRKPLLRRNEFPQKMQFLTTHGLLKVIWQQANTLQLAAPSPPPQLEGKHDLAVRVHESLVGNFSRAMLGGVTLTDEKLAEILEEATGKVPEELQPTGDKDPWAITFSLRQPMTATFSNDTIRFAIRGRKFRLGDREFVKTMEMSAVYRVEKTAEGARFTRQGDVAVEYIGRRRPSNDEIVVRAVMRRKFEALFAAQFEGKGLKLPGRWESAGTLQLKQLQVDNGWLSIAWGQPAAVPPRDAVASIEGTN